LSLSFDEAFADFYPLFVEFDPFIGGLMLIEQSLILENVYPASKPKASAVLDPSETAPRQRVLAQSLLENSTTRQRRSPMDWAVSLLIHVGVLSLLIFLPLFFTQGIDMKRLETTILIAPMPPMAPLPAAAMARVVHTTPKLFTPGKLTAPTLVPKAVPVATNDSAPPEIIAAGNFGGVPGGVLGGQLGEITGGMPSVAPPVPAATLVAGAPKRPVPIGGNVKPPKLLYGPAPVYPILARQSQIHGQVIIDATIDEHGNVVRGKVVSGHPLLIEAAVKAVKQRKYEPTILDGEPTPVDLRVEVNFQM
jgi:protein TonB